MEDKLLGSFFVQLTIVGLSLALSAFGALHALLRKREPRSALGWIAVCIGLPFLGPFLYFLFGINRIHTRARKLRKQAGGDYPGGGAEATETGVTPASGAWRRGLALGYTSGNLVEPLYGQNHAYANMLTAIDNARESVLLSSYIFLNDAAGKAFVASLSAAAARGVCVHVLIDGIGEFYSLRRVAKPLRAAGVSVARFLPPRLFPPAFHINLRNHRKILLVDGRVAFTGGMNISGKEVGEAVDPDTARDLQFRLRGPVVAQICEVFCADWEFASGEPVSMPAMEIEDSAGAASCRVIIDGPDENLDSLALRMVSAVAGASHSVTIMTPYFVPTRELTGALKAAAAKGVRVRVLLPKKSNLPFVDWATRKLLWEFLQVDVEVYFLAGEFRHSKLLLVDDEYVMLGSANWDSRSLRLNFEIGVEVLDGALRVELRDHAEHARKASKRATLAEMDGRHLLVKLRDAIAWLGAPYL